MKMLTKAALVACGLGLSQLVLAASPVGTWKTIDDKTNQPKALVQITEQNGELSGKVVKLFNNPEAKCTKCEGANKDKPVVGMTILWGLKAEGSGWEGGKILDPKSGDVYKAKAKLVGDNTLEVRGFLGISLLGRTQEWQRQ